MKKLLLSLILTITFISFPQTRGVFVEPQKGFLDEIYKSADEFANPQKPKKPTFRVDFSKVDPPQSLEEFKTSFYNPPVSQGRTGTCWCFSTTSFFESEINRISGKKVKLSELFTVYNEYIEKAIRYIRERGDSEFSEGSEANAVTRLWKKYGVVPAEAYSGMLPGQKFHDHEKMIQEMQSYLKNVKANYAWNEEEAVNTIKSILNHYLGVPPAKVNIEGKEYTPQQYLTDYLKLNMDDYVDFMSLMEKPYYKKVEYEVTDNWWHSADYYNVPLNEYINAVKNAVKSGYTLVIGGDVSEAGYDTRQNLAIVPDFDVPSKNIDENARQFRFSNGTTQDDHGIHIVGYTERNGKTWFLIKDSGAGSRNGKFKGYVFYDEDYVKLKIMDFMVHKDAVKDLLSRFK